MATLQLSNHYGHAANWELPNPDYLQHLDTVGGASGSASAQVSLAIGNLATRSPVVLGFVLEADPNYIHVGHSPQHHNPNPTSTTSFDEHIMVLVGNDLNTTIPLVISNANFSRPDAALALDTATITGAQGFGANPQVLRTGHRASWPRYG